MFVKFLRAGVHDAEGVVSEGDGVCAERVTEGVGCGRRMVWDRTETEFAWCPEGE